MPCLHTRSPDRVSREASHEEGPGSRAAGRRKFKEEEADDQAEAALEDQAIAYWTAITENIPQWKDVLEGDLKPAEVRAEFINAHAVAFWALGAAGKALIDKYPDDVSWKARLGHLAEIDWRKTNPEWQGICMLGSDIITRRRRLRQRRGTSSGNWGCSMRSQIVCSTSRRPLPDRARLRRDLVRGPGAAALSPGDFG